MENINFSLADVQYLLFILPGFILVWTYRFFTYAKNIGEFEYACLSFVWGFILVGMTGWVLKYLPNYSEIQKSVYLFTLWFCTFGFFIGWFGSFVVRWKWVKKAVNFIRPENFFK